jgi:hypothetical protein
MWVEMELMRSRYLSNHYDYCGISFQFAVCLLETDCIFVLFDLGHCGGITQRVQVEAVGRVGNVCWKGTGLLGVGDWLCFKALRVLLRFR